MNLFIIYFIRLLSSKTNIDKTFIDNFFIIFDIRLLILKNKKYKDKIEVNTFNLALTLFILRYYYIIINNLTDIIRDYFKTLTGKKF